MTNESEHHYLQIISLPSGVEQPDFELIGSLWEETLKWSNNRVQVKMTEAVSPGKFMKRVYSFDVTSIGTGVGTEEPLLGTPTNETDGVNLWDDGPGWVAYLQWEPIGQNKWRAWNKWLGEKIGIKSKNERMHADTFRLVDSPSGKVHCEFPVSYPITLSDDAKRVACIDPNLGLEVWNADPWPRWPMALAAAVLAAGLVLLTGRWRTAARRRVTNTTTA